MNGELADGQQIKMMNPMNYIADDKAVKAEHFRIRHGAVDRDHITGNLSNADGQP